MEEKLALEEEERMAFLPDLDEYFGSPYSDYDDEGELVPFSVTEQRAIEEAGADALLRMAEELIASTDRLLAELGDEPRHP